MLINKVEDILYDSLPCSQGLGVCKVKDLLPRVSKLVSLSEAVIGVRYKVVILRI